MSIKERLDQLVTHIAQPVPSIFIDRPGEPLTAEINRHYFRLWLSEVSLSYDRKWFQSYYPTVSALVRCAFDGKTIEVPTIAGEFKLSGVSATDLMQAVRLNYALTSLLPLTSDTVEVLAVLVAMPGENALTRFINVLSDFSRLLTVPQISGAMQVAEKLAGGINDVLSIGNRGALLGLHQTFTDKDGANPLRSGYLLVPLARESEIKRDQLLVVEGRLRVGADLAHNEAVTAYPYMLFHIEVRAQREDWTSFQNIWTPLQQAIKALQKGERGREDADAYIRTAIGEALLTPDLVLYDRNAVAKKVQAFYDEATKDLGLGAVSFAPTSLDDVMSLVMPETEMPRDRLLTFRELFPAS